MSTNIAEVILWGESVGAVLWNERSNVASFEFSKAFLNKNIDPSPIFMSALNKGDHLFSFPALQKDTFQGLPGMLADSLPDKYGSAMIDVWLADHGRARGSMNPVEKLLYIGNRGMGALEYKPATQKRAHANDVDIDSLVTLANNIMQQKKSFQVCSEDKDALASILQIGTSAGGARPKGIIAIHKDTQHIISGQAYIPEGYEHWIIKFDGVSDMELGEPMGYGRIEYAYYLMARDADIDMMESRLWESNGHAHFMTQRFDRDGNEKIHMQSLCGIAHYDFNMARHYSYEQAMHVALRIGLSNKEITEMYRRMVFNVMARNQDDHTKNISFLMDKNGHWKLSPAYDVTYSFNQQGPWTSEHQMLINNKSDDFLIEDLLLVAQRNSVKNADKIIDKVRSSIGHWQDFAKKAGVPTKRAVEIKNTFRFQSSSMDSLDG